MPNIMINSYCNLKCPYCFADNELSDCSTKNMSLDDFERIIEWHKNNNMRMIRIIGGEPTLHPEFLEIVCRIMVDDFFEGMHIFSNMSFGRDVKAALLEFASEKKLSFLPNFNEEFVVGPKYEVTKNNIRTFANLGCIKTLGVNIYKPDYDFTEFIKMANEARVIDIRWTLTTPHFVVDKDFDVKGYFRSFYDTLIRFFKICQENRIPINQDCNSIPMCSFTDEQLSNLIRHNPVLFSKKLACNPVIDINPQMEVFRCFGTSEDYKIKLNPKMKMKGYMDIMDSEFYDLESKLLFDECKDCQIFDRNDGRSCACINYRRNR